MWHRSSTVLWTVFSPVRGSSKLRSVTDRTRLRNRNRRGLPIHSISRPVMRKLEHGDLGRIERCGVSRTWCRAIAAALFICSLPATATRADDSRLCEREMTRAARVHGIPIGILYAVGLTETGRRGSLQPYALAAEGETIFA